MLTAWQQKRIAVVGLGLSGQATVRFLLQHGIRPVLMDSRRKVSGMDSLPLDKTDGLYLGELDANRLAQMDVLVVSPGLDLRHPAIRFAVAQGVEVMGDIELFARCNSKPVIAITGSNGKSTVTRMVEAILQHSGIKAVAAGNIGLPALDAIQSADTEVFVLELSSFQLDTTKSLQSLASTILNISADHLDRYPSMQAYCQSKQGVYQGSRIAFYNRADSHTLPQGKVSEQHSLGLDAPEDVDGYGIAERAGNDYLVLAGSELMPVSQLSLLGRHNHYNALTAAALSLAAGADFASIRHVLSQFQGLEHRCQLVHQHNEIRWVNDSKATNIGATLAALDGLRPVIAGQLILLAGGDGKGQDMTELSQSLQQQVDQLITFGQDGPAIAALKAGSHQVKDLTEAVSKAATLAQPGDLVLLSPACASLDMFSNYQQRGERFAKAAKEVAR
ncbi:UDP-N-acetylmuramoyl-L-alanine--D-glutamate ligase [Alkalimonas amylolytica]|uniref:UDP-N-acetylmuramoylalanine--D-glutamate ligase n=1 Tax=Alkalimonas amylolytica TaxID=152573 RepID=A0A1H4E7Q4_ALKAM|nr:UDP-N-acetylmuramoyl-L-alanine--D-glutamate ligase [Alkalimonas amylolytica]SEA81063.1 UDP-N-acetylmuramoylalanine--D-glutamate ligase [Alkalimonas amylolytica]